MKTEDITTENKLPADFKAKWVAALRSGEYQQGTGGLVLSIGGVKSYCCLGVACLIATGEDPYDTASGYINGDKINLNGVPELLIGTGEKNDTVRTLVRMNDGIGENRKTFSEIAAYIEANL